jgi:hypothetical protein
MDREVNRERGMEIWERGERGGEGEGGSKREINKGKEVQMEGDRGW